MCIDVTCKPNGNRKSKSGNIYAKNKEKEIQVIH